MNAGIKLLDKYAEMCKHASDSETARALKVRPSAVNNWRHGRAMPNAEMVEKMCTATGEPLAKWLHMIEAERARTPADRRVWLRLAQVAAVILAALPAAAHNLTTMYIMLKRWVAVFLRKFHNPRPSLPHGGRHGSQTFSLAVGV